jgi:hypothetical protein
VSVKSSLNLVVGGRQQMARVSKLAAITTQDRSRWSQFPPKLQRAMRTVFDSAFESARYLEERRLRDAPPPRLKRCSRQAG